MFQQSPAKPWTVNSRTFLSGILQIVTFIEQPFAVWIPFGGGTCADGRGEHVACG